MPTANKLRFAPANLPLVFLRISKPSSQPMHSILNFCNSTSAFFQILFNSWAGLPSQEDNTYCLVDGAAQQPPSEGRRLASSQSSQSHLFLLFSPIHPPPYPVQTSSLSSILQRFSTACSSSPLSATEHLSRVWFSNTIRVMVDRK